MCIRDRAIYELKDKNKEDVYSYRVEYIDYLFLIDIVGFACVPMLSLIHI